MVTRKEIDDLRACADKYDENKYQQLLVKLLENKNPDLLHDLLFLRPFDEIEDSGHEMWQMIHVVESFPIPMAVKGIVDAAVELRQFSETFFDTLIIRLGRASKKEWSDEFTKVLSQASPNVKETVCRVLRERLSSTEIADEKDRIRAVLSAAGASEA